MQALQSVRAPLFIDTLYLTFCLRIHTVERTVESKFEDEPRRPPMNNLAKHTGSRHAEKLNEPEANPGATLTSTPTTHGFNPRSAEIMEKWLAEGELNPLIEPTRKGFLRLFAAWILEEDLPFTTGEAPPLQQLFQYLKIQYVLPSDTTVRNTLARIFVDLHVAIVRELAVCLIYCPIHQLMTLCDCSPSSLRLPTQRIRGRHLK